MKKRICFLVLTILSLSVFQPSQAQPVNADTSSVKKAETDVFSNKLDSLASLKIFPDTILLPGVDARKAFFFNTKYGLSYRDSLYRSNMYALSLSSPFGYVYNGLIKSYIELYGVKRAKLTARLLGLAELYFPLFEEYLDKYGLPMELKYLAVIESALNPMARSGAGASGLWQFMFNTGKMYGLKVTSYTDDRCDPIKATIAACQHLRDLYSTFNDWSLVLAAYNAGAGNVNKAIIRARLAENEKPSFWKIRPYLPRETQNYVPAFIGASYVMKYPEEFGISAVAPSFSYSQIDTIIIKRPLSFKQISEIICTPEDEIKFLNPMYKKSFIPASEDSPYVLRLNKNYIAEFIKNEDAIYNYNNLIVTDIKTQQLLASNSQQQQNIPAKKTTVVSNTDAPNRHIVKKGESLNMLARKYNCSVSDIMEWNNMKTPMIHPNQKLIVQGPVNKNIKATSLTENPALTSTSNVVANVNASATNQQSQSPEAANKNSKIIYHTIRKGDTLWGIANKYNGASIEEIKKLNNIKENQKLMPGQKLKIAIDG